MAPASQPMFSKDEKALCFHHELLYEAKVLDVKALDPNDKKSAYLYKVHYKGWKATWDDWVPQDRLRKLNDENRELANNLKKELEAMRRGSQAQKTAATSHKKKPEAGSARGSEGRETPVASTSLAGRKRGRDFEVERVLAVEESQSGKRSTQRKGKSQGKQPPEGKSTPKEKGPKKRKRNELGNEAEMMGRPAKGAKLVNQRRTTARLTVLKNWGRSGTGDSDEETFRTRPAIRLHMPDRLKSLLVDDWENITKNLQLINIPVKVPVSAILDMYEDQESPKRIPGSAEADILEEIIAGVKEYFNKALGRILLYRFERDQYLEIYKRTESPTDALAGKTMCEIYGGEHLLRLFVSLPELIAQTNMDPQSVNRLREELVKITMWLNKDETVGKVFVSEYESPGVEYVDKAKGDEKR
ncbi:histone acetylase complex subunit [Diplodia corticola]|uniref:Chromatin modification-related protein EAF3 n=1 Tax=Diplodia corticola TaxID=236234 RepID=A0A1J9RTN2_9PEZI|nr:histone acetylase complex subunit [Diplodia corticola]OJD31783.1 histone acetylase complex subunit [Diplodia corticola]